METDEPPTIIVAPYGPGWVGLCNIHGAIGPIWVQPWCAGYDVLGHATHHHRQVLASDHE